MSAVCCSACARPASGPSSPAPSMQGWAVCDAQAGLCGIMPGHARPAAGLPPGILQLSDSLSFLQRIYPNSG